MASSTRYYYSLPTEAPPSRSSSRRPTLTPSIVSSPCITTYVQVPRRDSVGSSGRPTKAHALLAKVVSSPSTPRGETPSSTPMPTPESVRSHYASSNYSADQPAVWRSKTEHYAGQYRQQDGYFSFPDFEKFCEKQNPYEQHRQHAAVKT